MGFLFTFFAGLASLFSLHLLTMCSYKVNPPASFHRITEAAFPKYGFVVDLAVASLCFGNGVSYLIVVSNLMPDVMDQFGVGGLWHHREIWVVIGLWIVGPISCFKSLDALQFTSSLAVVLVVFITGLILIYAVTPGMSICGDDDDSTDDTACAGSTRVASLTADTIRYLGVFVFAYTCQMVRLCFEHWSTYPLYIFLL